MCKDLLALISFKALQNYCWVKGIAFFSKKSLVLIWANGASEVAESATWGRRILYSEKNGAKPSQEREHGK